MAYVSNVLNTPARKLSLCKANLKQIGIGIHNYGYTYNDRLPDRDGASFLAALYVTGMVNDNQVFLCPASGHEDPTGSKLVQTYLTQSHGQLGEEDGTSYTGRLNASDSPFRIEHKDDMKASRTSVAADESLAHHTGTFHILFLDGHAETKKRIKRVVATDPSSLYEPLAKYPGWKSSIRKPPHHAKRQFLHVVERVATALFFALIPALLVFLLLGAWRRWRRWRLRRST
jgi:prepilin-type processing-associated H-X9-DG protein